MSEALNVTKASFGGLREVTTSPLWQWDYGQILQITGLDLPQAFEVHFSNSRKSGETITQIGTNGAVTIPDMYLTSGADIYAFIFLHDGLTDGETEYVIKIPVRERPEPSDIEPTPEQQDVITEAIAALNQAVEQCEAYVEHYPTVIDGYWYVWDEATEQFITTGVPATGNGIASARLNQDYTLTLTFTDGTSFTTPISIRGAQGEKGDTGAVPNFSIGTVTTLPAGSSASASITGTQEQPVLNLNIPQGQDGAITNLDTTLTVSGKAADGKAVGDRISELPSIANSTAEGVDLDVSDPSGNVLVRFSNGHVKTKEFDSSELAGKFALKQNVLTFDDAPTEGSSNPVKSGGVYSALQNAGDKLVYDSVAEGVDLDISDNYGNVLVRFSDGGVKTKQFDGKKYTTFSANGQYALGQSTTITIDRMFKKGDRIVLHVEHNAAPWASGGRVAYYADSIQITGATWRGAEAYLEYILPNDVDGISAVFPTNAFNENTSFTFEVSLLGDIPITPTVVTIKKDGSGDYTNLKACLTDIAWKANDVLNPYRIEIYPGEYNVLDDYTQAEIEDIFYGEISVNQYSQTSFVGPKLLNGMSLVGMGNPSDVILTAWLDPEPQTDLYKRMRGQISTLNLQGSGSIENLTIVAQNMRYCVHDDFSAPLGKKCKRVVKNCVFRGYNIAYGPHTTYGAGMPQGGMDFLFVGCDFGEDVGVHTQPTLYTRPEIHLIDCKGHSFRIGDNETVSPVEEYTLYKLDNCDFLDVRQGMEDSVPHVKLYGSGGSCKFYQLDSQMEYNTGEITLVPLSVLGTALTVGTCVEMYNDNGSGPRFRAITALANFAGIVVFVDDNDNTYIQTRGFVRTDRLGLASFALNDYVGLSGTACAVVASASDAFGQIVYIDYQGKGYVKLGGKF